MSFHDLLPHRCKIRSFSSADDYGQPTFVEGTEFPCRFSPQSGRVVRDDQGENAVIDGRVYFATDQTVDRKDELIVNDDTFEIVTVHKRIGTTNDHHYEIDVRKKNA